MPDGIPTKQVTQYSTSRRNFLSTTKSVGLALCTAPLWSGADRASAEPDNKKEIIPAKKPMQTGLVSDARYLQHKQSKSHPESPERLKAIHTQLEKTGIDKQLTSIPPSVDPQPYIRMVHSDQHIQVAAKQAHDDAICRLAVSGALSAVDAVVKGKVTNAFCAIRPSRVR